MDYAKLPEDLKRYAKMYIAGDSCGRMIMGTGDLMLDAAEAIEQLLKIASLVGAKRLSLEQLNYCQKH